MAKTKLDPNPGVFLEAAERVRRELNHDRGITCCDAMRKVMRLASYEDLWDTDEYKFFKKMFCKGQGRLDVWFGLPETDLGYPKVKNQEKRLRALNKAFAAAKELQKKGTKNVGKSKKS